MAEEGKRRVSGIDFEIKCLFHSMPKEFVLSEEIELKTVKNTFGCVVANMPKDLFYNWKGEIILNGFKILTHYWRKKKCQKKENWSWGKELNWRLSKTILAVLWLIRQKICYISEHGKIMIWWANLLSNWQLKRGISPSDVRESGQLSFKLGCSFPT